MNCPSCETELTTLGKKRYACTNLFCRLYLGKYPHIHIEIVENEPYGM